MLSNTCAATYHGYMILLEKADSKAQRILFHFSLSCVVTIEFATGVLNALCTPNT